MTRIVLILGLALVFACGDDRPAPPADGGTERDGAVPDGGSFRDGGGETDSGIVAMDGGVGTDGGELDGGPSATDSGTSTDAGPMEADSGIRPGDCMIASGRVFATEREYLGDFGGIAGGDAACTAAAAKAGITGTFRAWLSDSTTNARDRITGGGPWYLPTGELVACDIDDLLDGVLWHAIDVTEYGLPARGPLSTATQHLVWTGTRDDGTAHTITCTNWTSFSGSGASGNPNNADSTFTQWRSGSCGNPHRIYCFQYGP